MRRMTTVWLVVCVLSVFACSGPEHSRSSSPPGPSAPPVAAPAASDATSYVPQAQYCSAASGAASAVSPLCATIPANIANDPALNNPIGYSALKGVNPPSPANDVQTPFDNLSWQTFVSLNWTQGQQSQDASEGLQGTGP